MFAGFLAGFLAFTIVEWVAAAAFLVFLVISIATYSHEKYGPSFFTMVVSLVGLGFLFKANLLDYVHASGLVLGIAKPLIAYIVIGLVVSFVNWVFFCMRAKEKYREKVLKVLQSTASYNNYVDNIKKGLGVLKVKTDAGEQVVDVFGGLSKGAIQTIIQAFVATNHAESIFGNSYAYPDRMYWNALDGLNAAESEALAVETLAAALPPKATRGKAILASAIFEWPITILSLVFSRILTVLVDKLIYASRKVIDKVSHISFGSTDISV
jgi:hypothetical protein